MIWQAVSAVFFAAVLGGMRITYGRWEWSGIEAPFHRVWKEKKMYLAAFCWLIVYGICFLVGRLYVEAEGGAAAVIGRTLIFAQLADLAGTYLLLALVDGKKREVPDSILICFLAAQLLLGAAGGRPERLIQTLISGTLFAVVMLLTAYFSGERIGMGDAKLLSVTAMTAGIGYTVQILCLALIPTFFFGVWMLFRHRLSKKTEVPFVPFLAVGVAVSFLLAVV